MDREARRATIHGVTESDMAEWLSTESSGGFQGVLVVKNLPAMQVTQETQVGSLEYGRATLSSILAWKIHGHSSLAGYSWSPWDANSWTRLSHWEGTPHREHWSQFSPKEVLPVLTRVDSLLGGEGLGSLSDSWPLVPPCVDWWPTLGPWSFKVNNFKATTLLRKLGGSYRSQEDAPPRSAARSMWQGKPLLPAPGRLLLASDWVQGLLMQDGVGGGLLWWGLQLKGFSSAWRERSWTCGVS